MFEDGISLELVESFTLEAGVFNETEKMLLVLGSTLINFTQCIGYIRSSPLSLEPEVPPP